MFTWLNIGGAVAAVLFLGGAVAWIRADAANDAIRAERQRVAFANERLQKEEEKRTSGIVSAGRQEADAEAEAMAEKDRQLGAANTRIEDLERKNATCGMLSRDAVRELNRLR